MCYKKITSYNYFKSDIDSLIKFEENIFKILLIITVLTRSQTTPHTT